MCAILDQDVTENEATSVEIIQILCVHLNQVSL